MNMDPTVGRIVHYTGFGDGYLAQKDKCFAAIVTRVRHVAAGTTTSLDLTVFPPDAAPFTDTDVTGGGDEPGHGQWHWPEREG